MKVWISSLSVIVKSEKNEYPFDSFKRFTADASILIKGLLHVLGDRRKFRISAHPETCADGRFAVKLTVEPIPDGPAVGTPSESRR